MKLQKQWMRRLVAAGLFVFMSAGAALAAPITIEEQGSINSMTGRLLRKILPPLTVSELTATLLM